MLRDLFILSLFAYFCYRTFKQPYIGVLVMLCITYMSPHRLSPWTISYSLPLFFMMFLVTATAFLFQKDKDQFQWHRLHIWMLIFMVWGIFSTLFALHPDWAIAEMSRVIKIQIGIVFMILICQGEHRIKAMIWVIALSLAFYGVKGGIFTVLTGAQFRVWGPPDSFIEGNNELALALLMTIPLLFFLFSEAKNKWVKRALMVTMGLCFISVVGSYSRGAFLGLIATAGFLWLKSKYKAPLAVLGIVAVLGAVPFLPDHWFERMETIKTYEEDRSAMGRINAWTAAYNVANDRLTGGGYRFWSPLSFAVYAPSPEDVHDAHSIYFEVLGELGWPGLAIYLIILWGWWRLSAQNAKLAKGHVELKWCVTFSQMSQVTQIAYMSTGAFLGLAYWNMPYELMTIAILVNIEVRRRLADKKSATESETDVPTRGAGTSAALLQRHP
ncbi:putative O-glycosylation ligase, exosortase A system-associated [Bowmanella sp. Y26]|uniref:putative O-glycosylation ligase, exosortase A system-associated n=1 Tax=Bowmanella yangjiangensis TaxID=2811230 RepID=UPI001BDCD3DB|nr:putative O-glycosylation ligase, exosortase A system-associated [Bowmanella yangjiangensis]